MTPEEYQRIKEAEKAHLRKLKELKKAMHLLERRRSVNQALEDMTGGSKDVFDEHASMVEKLALETAQQEARLEIALESAQLEDDGTAAGEAEQLEEDLLKARARALLQQMKRQMGSPADDELLPSEGRPAPSKGPEAAENPPPPPAPLPEKTIGRMKP